jgi:hypothetical protein
MSDDKQVKSRRVAQFPKAVPNPTVSALPVREPVVALPAPIPMLRPQQAGADKLFAAYWETLASIGQAQAAMASNVTAIALEMSGLARSNLTAAGDSVAALFGAKSLADAVEIQLGFARRSLDAVAEGSTRLGEIGLCLANDAAKPVLGRFVG